MISKCPFCEMDRPLVLENGVAVAFRDTFPLAEGHTLVVPKHHVATIFDLGADEQVAIWSLVAKVRESLVADFHPDGFNIGLNDGPAAGQTVMHAHVHVIPRRMGDSDDPRGGIRWVLPKKAKYW
jgi:diadenosine tetraphosphate (Ap4A) HIT family hydrolase